MRLGVDLGGTKTEIMALDAGGRKCCGGGSPRCATMTARWPPSRDLVAGAESELGARGSGRDGDSRQRQPPAGLIKNANPPG